MIKDVIYKGAREEFCKRFLPLEFERFVDLDDQIFYISNKKLFELIPQIKEEVQKIFKGCAISFNEENEFLEILIKDEDLLSMIVIYPHGNYVTIATYYATIGKKILLQLEFNNFVSKVIQSPSTKEKFYFLQQSGGSLVINGIEGTCESKPLDINNYNDDVVDDYKEIVEKWNKFSSDNGRLVLITGIPGSGKTYMIRSMQNELKNYKFINISSSVASSLASPDIMSSIIEFKQDMNCGSDEEQEDENKNGIIFVIEDADSLIQKRDGYNNDLTSAILNLTDGIFASTLDIRIIMTTNVKHEDFDDAIKRNGRLFKHIQINELCAEKVKNLLKVNNCTSFPKNNILADVYATIRGSERKSEKENRKIGF